MSGAARIALISDIHGNLHALDAVLADMDAVGCDDIVCLGDLVGYGGDPEACVQRVRERASICLLGNHDAVAAELQSDEGFNDMARGAIRRTRILLSEEALQYLRELPLTHQRDDVLLAHAHPIDPEGWTYILVGFDTGPIFREGTARLFVVGHTHAPGVSDDERPTLAPLDPGPLALAAERRYLVNVGSVGQPRDRDPRAAWALLDLAAGSIELRRVDYDIPAAARRIIERGMPAFLADRLRHGV